MTLPGLYSDVLEDSRAEPGPLVSAVHGRHQVSTSRLISRHELRRRLSYKGQGESSGDGIEVAVDDCRRVWR